MIGVDAWLARSQPLCADLRDAGLPTGLGEQLKVLRLLQLLEQRGAAPDTPEALAQWIAPVLCSRSDQVKALRRVLDTHFFAAPRGRPIAAIGLDATSPAIPDRTRRRFSLLWPLGVLATIGVAAAVAALVLTDRIQKVSVGGVEITFPGQTNALSVSLSGLVASSVVIIVLLAVAAFLLWRRIRLAVRHGHVIGDGKPQQVRVDEPADDKDNPQLLRAARMLNRPKRWRTRRLDVRSTVRATAEAGGRFSPVELIRRVPANWLLLVERGAAQDPLPAFGARLSTLLARSGVRHTLYEFRRSPEWVRRKDPRDGPRGKHMPLERALADDRPTRVLMLAEASRVVDEETGGPARWLTDHDVPTPVLLTPNAQESWSAAESSAAQAGVLVLPADGDGLSSLARRIQADELEPSLFVAARETQLERWQAERFTWLSQSEPAPTVRARLIASLRTLLHKNEFRLLVGIAAFPQVRLDLIATLDRKLNPHDAASVQRARLLKLGRLVWVKEGIIPDWLRQDLMRSLPAAEIREVRERWMDLLADEPGPGKPGSELTIHLAEGSAEAGAQGDGLFLGFMRGEYDLPAPLRLVRLAGLWRAPDRTELIVAAAGVAIAVLALLVDLNLRAWAENGLRAWQEAVRDIRDAAALPRPVLLAFAFLPAIAAQFLFAAALFRPFLPKHSALHAIAATLLALPTVAGGWLLANTDAWASFKTPALDFTAPLVVAAGIVLLMLWPLRAPEVAAADLRRVVQESRGTGLSDRPTLLVLLWLFLAGVANNVILTWPFGFRLVAAAWLIAIAVLGFMRAALISLSNAPLQAAPSRPAGTTRDAAIGLVLGQAWGAALAWMVVTNLPGGASSESNQFVSWHINNGLMLFGAALGVAAALWRRGLINNAALYWGAAVAFLAYEVQAAGVMLLGLEQQVAALEDLAFAVMPASVVALLAFANVAQAKDPWRPIGLAVLILSVPSGVILAMSWLGMARPSSLDWQFALPLVAATVATWPLVQRALTDEPSVAGEPAGWRPRPAAPELWVLGPVVLLTVLQVPIGPFVLDLPSLVIPLAIVLGWRFGLRGFRTAILMVLPALWFFVPVMLSGFDFAPFRALLPDASQFAVPAWIVPITLDVAATALLAGALFARRNLFPQIRGTTRLPRWAVVALALVLSLQIGGQASDRSVLRQLLEVPLSVLTGETNDPRDLEQRRLLVERLKAQGRIADEQVNQRLNEVANVLQQGRPAPSASPDGKAAGGAEQRSQNIAPLQVPSAQQVPNAAAPQGGAAQGEVPPSGGGNYPVADVRAPAGWMPQMVLVLALFLIATANLGWQATVIVASVALAGLASLALAVVGLRTGPMVPLSVMGAVAGLLAYGVGLYHERICHENSGGEREVRSATSDVVASGALTLCALGAAVASYSLAVSAFEGSVALFALAVLLSWTAAVRAGDYDVASIACAVLLVVPVFLGVAVLPIVMDVMPTISPLYQRLPVPVFAGFLLVTSFVIGRQCRSAVMLSATATSVAVVAPQSAQREARGFVESITRWSGISLEWFARLRQDARDRAAAGRQMVERLSNALAKFGEDKAEQPATEQPQTPGTEQPQATPPAPGAPSGLLDAIARLLPADWANWLRNRFGAPGEGDSAERRPAPDEQPQTQPNAPATTAAEQPYLLTTRPDAVDDWCFVVGIAHYINLPSLPGAANGAAAFREWAISLTGGGVPEEQTALVWSGEGSPSASDLQERLRRFVQGAVAGRERGRTPRRLYLYVAGYTLGGIDEVSLVMANAGQRSPGVWQVGVKRWADTICHEGPFREVLLLVDGWTMPADAAPWSDPSASDLSPVLPTNASPFYAVAMEPDRRTTGPEARSIFSTALLEGLRGAAMNTSGRVTGNSLRLYLSHRMEALARDEALYVPKPAFHYDVADIVITSSAVTPA